MSGVGVYEEYGRRVSLVEGDAVDRFVLKREDHARFETTQPLLTCSKLMLVGLHFSSEFLMELIAFGVAASAHDLPVFEIRAQIDTLVSKVIYPVG